jgi:cation diffusion facilitator family transporter
LAGGSKKAVYAALFGNMGIALAKFVAALLTGSVAMWAETYHSVSDTFNQILLLIGIRTSTKSATERHPFGHGKEQFFWSFLVATMMFGISGILALEQGATSLLKPEQYLQDPGVNYIILAISAGFESYSLHVAFSLFRETIKSRGQKLSFASIIEEFRESKDPSVMTVLIEDSAALLGISIAAIGIFLTQTTGNHMYDAISSLAIGALLMVFAFLLARENKNLLVGEAISRRDYKKVAENVLQIPEVNRIVSMRTMHLAPRDVLVAMEVNLRDGLDTDRIEIVIDQIEQKVKQALPYISMSKIYIELEQDSCPTDFRMKDGIGTRRGKPSSSGGTGSAV